ncbi:hypothetical protein H9M94_03545 [Mycoplasma sp. Pen4]|uniref:hypothetical protein n=1 Tax=Mycoplasma sp. Pen4 TaxID=640330 RepID=UPI00165478B5|nr:hypothetical protein [Mycoplasma sp. Pen4]QNM93641.1 hypothetical protein H9M94_03545 [Mycoplasma sp. Pen4]
MMKKIQYNKKDIYKLFKKEFLDKNIDIKKVSAFLNIHIGTIKRWILHKEVPPQYFNDLNKLCNYKYELDVNEEEKFKIYDQFFTNKNSAKDLVSKSILFIKNKYKININEYCLIDPCAGDGSFFNSFPKQHLNKIALDIDPKATNIAKMDFFDFIPKTKKNIIINNPPFGLRGQLALKFINHAAKFSDFICFVLPPLFNSNGKDSPMLRVHKDLFLVAEFKVPTHFYYPNKKDVNVNAIFQIWTKIYNPKIKPINIQNKKSEYVRIFALSDGLKPSQKRNVKMIDKCDFYLPSTTFSKVKLENSFYSLPNNRGYGILILKNKNRICEIIKKINWEEKSFKSTNGANNLRTQLIINAIEERLK